MPMFHLFLSPKRAELCRSPISGLQWQIHDILGIRHSWCVLLIILISAMLDLGDMINSRMGTGSESQRALAGSTGLACVW